MKNVMETDRLLYTHAAVRIHPPNSLTEGQWVVTHLSEQRRLAISPNVCAILIAFMGGQSLLEACKEVTEIIDMPSESFGKCVVILEQKGLLVSEDNPEHAFAYNVAQQWSKYGWSDAADYHIATFDYPFYDYSSDGYQQDTILMNQYVTKEPDINRSKEYTSASFHLQVPSTRDSLDILTTSLRDLWNDPISLQPIDVHHIKNLMATTFGRLRSRRIRGMSGRADLVRKTSPSGGSRHPIEGYVVIQSIPGIDAGIYHFSVGQHVLEYIGKPLSDDELAQTFFGHERAPFHPRAYVVLTCIFERNMWRYREPRTYRTVYMDAGHVLGTIEVTAQHFGLMCYPHHGIDEPKLEELLELQPLSEAIFLAIALGGKGDEHEHN